MRCYGKKCIGSAYRKEIPSETKLNEAKDAMATLIAKRQADQASYIVPTLRTSQTPSSAPALHGAQSTAQTTVLGSDQ